MATIKSYNENLTLDADGTGSDLIFKSNGSQVGSLTDAGLLSATTFSLGNWTVTESVGVLYFATGGVNKMKLDASGNLTVVGNITAYGTI